MWPRHYYTRVPYIHQKRRALHRFAISSSVSRKGVTYLTMHLYTIIILLVHKHHHATQKTRAPIMEYLRTQAPIHGDIHLSCNLPSPTPSIPQINNPVIILVLRCIQALTGLGALPPGLAPSKAFPKSSSHPEALPQRP